MRGRTWMGMAGGLAIVVASVLAPPIAGAAESSGFAGTWRSTDCAQWWEDGHLDCTVWGDGSGLWLFIGRGDAPRAIFLDDHATACANAGSNTTRWIGAGTGEYDDPFLWLTFEKSGCGVTFKGGYGGVQLYHDAGSDTVWEDPDGDGWGVVWYRLT